MASRAMVTGYTNPQATNTGFVIEAQVVVQDSAIPKHAVITVYGVTLPGATPATWNSVVTAAVIAACESEGFVGLTAARVNLPSYGVGS